MEYIKLTKLYIFHICLNSILINILLPLRLNHLDILKILPNSTYLFPPLIILIFLLLLLSLLLLLLLQLLQIIILTYFSPSSYVLKTYKCFCLNFFIRLSLIKLFLFQYEYTTSFERSQCLLKTFLYKNRNYILTSVFLNEIRYFY